MARRRRTPTSLIVWLLGVFISAAGSYAVYLASISAIKDMTQHQVERSQAAIQKIQQQEQERRRQQVLAQPTISLEERAQQHERAVAARLRQAELAAAARAKEEAWERYYEPSRACIYPESDSRTLVCEASERKARKQFEASWTTEQLQTLR